MSQKLREVWRSRRGWREVSTAQETLKPVKGLLEPRRSMRAGGPDQARAMEWVRRQTRNLLEGRLRLEL